MIFDIEENPGIWLDFPGGGRVQLRNPSVQDMLEIRKVCTDNKPFLQDGRVYNHEVMDMVRHFELYYDKAIIDWDGFFDKKSQPIPCTTQNKLILVHLAASGFKSFVDKVLEDLAKADAQKVEDEKKI